MTRFTIPRFFPVKFFSKLNKDDFHTCTYEAQYDKTFEIEISIDQFSTLEYWVNT